MKDLTVLHADIRYWGTRHLGSTTQLPFMLRPPFANCLRAFSLPCPACTDLLPCLREERELLPLQTRLQTETIPSPSKYPCSDTDLTAKYSHQFHPVPRTVLFKPCSPQEAPSKPLTKDKLKVGPTLQGWGLTMTLSALGRGQVRWNMTACSPVFPVWLPTLLCGWP